MEGNKMTRILRWRYIFQSHVNIVKRMNRCVEVEAVLLDVANKKRDTLTREECRQLAFKLAGVATRLPLDKVK